MEMIMLDEMLGGGSYGTVFTTIVDCKKEAGVIKVFSPFGPRGGELVSPVSLFDDDDEEMLGKDPDYDVLLWDFLTCLVPEIAARGAGVADLAMQHCLLHVSGHGLMWGAVMPQVRPLSFSLYRSFNEQQRLKFAGGLQRALHKVHTEGYIHGDVKPDNIALNADNSVILIDFGLFTAAPCVIKNRGAIYAEEFRAPEFYLAPDQSVIVVTQAADIWAAGITLLALELGHYVGVERLRRIQFTNCVNDNFDALQREFPHFNPCILALAATMLIVDPALRQPPIQPNIPPGNPGAGYVGMLNPIFMDGLVHDTSVIVNALDAEEKVLTNWEITRLVGCSLDLFLRAYATGMCTATKKGITMRLLNCACLCIASVISNLGGCFVFAYKDFKRVQHDLNFTQKDLLCTVYAVVEALKGKLMPPHKGAHWGLGDKELTAIQGMCIWEYFKIWIKLPVL